MIKSIGLKNTIATSLTVLSAIAVFVVLYHAKTIFAPIISALLLGVIMAPLSDLFTKLRLPNALAAFFSVVIALLLILIMLVFIEPYASQAIERAPVIWSELRQTIDEFKRVLQGLEEVSDELVAAIETSSGDDASGEAVTLPTITDALFYAPQFAAQFMVFTGTLYFFLMVRNELYEKMGRTFSNIGHVELNAAGRQVARYVLTISAINFGLGCVVATAMHIIGMPSPILWGLLAFALNFVLYLGPIALITMLTITGIVMFDGPTSFLPAALYFTLNVIEAQFVTPTLVGRSLSVNPLMVFLSLVFWLWLWGPIGGVIAIPLLIWCLTVFKGLADQTISSGTPGRLDASSSAGAAS